MQTIKIVVESIDGDCAAGCRVGDVFYYNDGAISVENLGVNLCSYALTAIIPYLSAACRAADNDWVYSVQKLQCPDITNKVVFRLERI